MELHAEEWGFAVGDAHDLAVAARFLGPGSDFEFRGERVGLNHQAVITRSLERIVETGEQPLAIVVDHVGLTVHEMLGADDLGAEGLAHRLMAEADAQQRQAALQALATFDRNAGFSRCARTGGDDDAIRLAVEDFIDRDLIVAVDLDVERRVDLAQPLDEVVSEGVVIIDEEDHGGGYGMQGTGAGELSVSLVE